MAGFLFGTAALTAASGATVATGSAATAIAAGGTASLAGGTLATTTGLLGAGGAFALAPTLATIGTATALGSAALGVAGAQSQAEAAEAQGRAELANLELGLAERELARIEALREFTAEQRVASALTGRSTSAMVSEAQRRFSRGLSIDRARFNLASAIEQANISGARRNARLSTIGSVVGGATSAIGIERARRI